MALYVNNFKLANGWTESRNASGDGGIVSSNYCLHNIYRC